MKWFSRSKVKPVTLRQPRYSKEDLPKRGDALYEDQIRSQVEEGNYGKIVAISTSKQEPLKWQTTYTRYQSTV